jgi:hypothetical protein
MSNLYISRHEMSAIKALDLQKIDQCIREALDRASSGGLYDLGLLSCGPYITRQLRKFERDLENFAKAKAAKKRSETHTQAWSSGHDLTSAVREMRRRLEDQEKETQLILLDDAIIPPHSFSDKVDVRVNYQCRRTIQDPWFYGSIQFFHNVDMRPDYTRPQPKRKPSAAKVERERQEKLYGHWETLRMQALHAVREFLKSEGDPARMPETFEAKPSSHDRYLNNFSCNFWLDQETKNN